MAAELPDPTAADPTAAEPTAAEREVRRAAVGLHAGATAVASLAGATFFYATTILGAAVLPTALAALVPVLLAALPLLVPERWRVPIAIANAVIVLAATVLGMLQPAQLGPLPTLALLCAPVAWLMWGAVVVPWEMARGMRIRRSLWRRIVGGLCLAVPAALMLLGFSSGTLLASPEAYWVVAAIFALALAFALGSLAASILAGVAGLAVLVWTGFEASMLFIAFWYVGGLFVTVGLAGSLAWGRRASGNDAQLTVAQPEATA